MRTSYTLGLTACALFVAASSAASAADLLVGNYSVTGFTTSSTCKATGTPQKGEASTSTIVFPGAGKTGLILANPSTTAKSALGGGGTQVCVATTKVPAGGLNGANLTFKCYADTEKGEASSVLATITAKFTIGDSHSSQINTVRVDSTIPILSCKFTTEGTFSHN